jgi:hypothetical protein
MVTDSMIDKATRFVVANGRLIERRLLELVRGPAQPAIGHAVLSALDGYRNPDGGLGHGLEADAQAPDSQPLAVDFALGVVDEVLELVDDDGVREHARDLARRTLPFLESVAAANAALPIVLPSVKDHPRADHWDSEEFPLGLNPTGGIVTRLRRLGVASGWLDRAEAYCRTEIDRALADDDLDGHTALNIAAVVTRIGDPEWADARLGTLADRLGSLTHFHLYPRPGYGVTPLHFAGRPDSPLRGLFPDDAIEAHLKDLESAQQDDGGWPITWQPPGVVAELTWRGVVTVGAVRTLTAYSARRAVR